MKACDWKITGLFFYVPAEMGCFSEGFFFFAGKAADSVFVDLFEYPVDLGGKLLLVLYFFLPCA